MNWQAVVNYLQEDSRTFLNNARGLPAASAAQVLQTAVILQSLANALQMGLNKRNEP
jgi:hypothetical protein